MSNTQSESKPSVTPGEPPFAWWQEKDRVVEAKTIPFDPPPVLDPRSAVAAEPGAASAAEGFSALGLRDRVVIMLLFDQVVREDQVELAWHLWHQMGRDGIKEPFWRVLTLFPELDRELIYAEAARVYGFEEARLSRPRALAMIQEMEARLPAPLWNEMVELRVVPITEYEIQDTALNRTVFATQDPTRPEVHRLMPKLKMDGFELRYASEGEIVNLLVEAFPHRYNHLKGLSGVAKDFLAGVEPSPPKPVAMPIKEKAAPDYEVADVLTAFEQVLIQAVREDATDGCLLPTPSGETEVYLQINDDLRRRSVIDHVAADTVLAVLKASIIQAEACGDGKIQKRLIERTIDGRLIRFRVSAVPPCEDVHAECIVLRVFS